MKGGAGAGKRGGAARGNGYCLEGGGEREEVWRGETDGGSVRKGRGGKRQEGKEGGARVEV